jgi:DNA-binding IclR family transcriptional regulator
VAALTPTGRAPERSPAPAVTRAAAVRDLLAATGGPLGVSAIARALELPKSSVANLCAALADTGLVQSTGVGFALGPRLAQLGAAYLAGLDPVALFHAACERSTLGREETVQLAVLGDGGEVVYLARRDGTLPVRLASAPGVALPVTCTATGKAMLAELSRVELEARFTRIGRLPKPTARSIGSVRALRTELERVRRRGWAIDREEVVEGVVCIGASIRPAGPTDPWLAVSVTLLAPRATTARVEALAGHLVGLARDIETGLGGRDRTACSAS